MPNVDRNFAAPGGGSGDRLAKVEPWAALGLALLAAASGFARLIGKPYAYDDLSVLEVVGRWRAGDYRLVDLLFLPHNEHLIAGLRALVTLATRVFGSDASSLHVVLVAWHGFGGWVVGRLVLAGGGSRVAALGATLLYVASSTTFAPSAVWYATGSVVMVSWVAMLLGQWAITSARPGLGVGLALGGLLAGTTGGLPGLAAPWSSLVIQGRERRGAAAFDRRWLGWAVALAGLALLGLFVVRTNYRAYSSLAFPALHLEGLQAAGILVGSAPGRLVQSFLPGCPGGWAMGAGWVGAIIGLWLAPARFRWLTGSVFLGAAMLSLAVGLMRPEYTLAHFEGADRYYYPLLAPLCLAAAGLLTRLPARRPIGWLVTIACAAPLWIGRERLVERFPASGLSAYEEYWARLDPLVRAIDEEARDALAPGPWHLVDGLVPGEGLQGPGLLLSTIVRTARPGLPGVSFSAPHSVEDLARENRALDRWADTLAEPVSSLCARSEGLADPILPVGSWLDFSRGAAGESVVSGLEPWTAPFRFMTGEPAVLRLAQAPGDLRMRVWVPDLSASFPVIEVAALVDGRDLGSRSVSARGGESEVSFPVPGGAELLAGRTVEVVLRASPSWRPIDHLEGNLDSRQLTMALLRIGFSAGHEPAVRPHGARFRCASGEG